MNLLLQTLFCIYYNPLTVPTNVGEYFEFSCCDFFIQPAVRDETQQKVYRCCELQSQCLARFYCLPIVNCRR